FSLTSARCMLTTITQLLSFSSRRRHTRSKRDWSSDVCSSDLVGGDNASGLMDCMNARVISTNIAVPCDNAAGTYSRTGINKQPAESISVFAPGPHYGDGSGVEGDFIGDDQHHGGAHKAVYAFSREELDFWQQELGRELIDGSFGENLTTQGINLGNLVINQRVRIGNAVLEVSVPRTPCATFAAWL